MSENLNTLARYIQRLVEPIREVYALVVDTMSNIYNTFTQGGSSFLMLSYLAEHFLY